MECRPSTLKGTPLFVRMNDEELARVLAAAELQEFGQDEIIVTEGEPGDTLYLVLAGSVRIVKKLNGTDIPIATLKEEDFFGEMSLIDLEPRSASVIANEPSTLLLLPSEKMASVFAENREILPILITNIARIISRRLRHADEQIARFLAREGSGVSG
jgi:CRP-like cAMP-binding protein